ncbi:hypothetical protein F4781DRAFT_155768 [Annulohypoxylon bovei var. microspora]|nr:hypothetical protein F4781DRAFT_155768 [Annulohypoxylon bovei var. microspora]
MVYNFRAAPPIPAYFIGAGSILLGVNCFIRPTQEYGRFGLPLEPAPRSKRERGEKRERGSERRPSGAEEGRASPLIHLKGIREVTYGLSLGVLKWLKHDDAVTAFTAIMALAGLGDGFVIWFNGGEKNRKKAWGHWGTFVILGGWSVWRALSIPRVAAAAGGFQVFRK